MRDNVLFGLPYDEDKYRAVIHACALELDLQILPQGGQTARLGPEYSTSHIGRHKQKACMQETGQSNC